jgi:hypothetical protein
MKQKVAVADKIYKTYVELGEMVASASDADDPQKKRLHSLCREYRTMLISAKTGFIFKHLELLSLSLFDQVEFAGGFPLPNKLGDIKFGEFDEILKHARYGEEAAGILKFCKSVSSFYLLLKFALLALYLYFNRQHIEVINDNGEELAGDLYGQELEVKEDGGEDE